MWEVSTERPGLLGKSGVGLGSVGETLLGGRARSADVPDLGHSPTGSVQGQLWGCCSFLRETEE